MIETTIQDLEENIADFEEQIEFLRIEVQRHFIESDQAVANSMAYLKNRMIELDERFDALDPKYIEAANTASDFFKRMIENNLNNFEFFLKSMGEMSGRIVNLEQKIENLETKVNFPGDTI